MTTRLIADARGDDVRTWAGYRRHRHGPFGLIVLVDSVAAGVEDDPSTPWSLICDAHATCMCFETQEQARWQMADPAGWCAPCNGEGEI